MRRVLPLLFAILLFSSGCEKLTKLIEAKARGKIRGVAKQEVDKDQSSSGKGDNLFSSRMQSLRGKGAVKEKRLAKKKEKNYLNSLRGSPKVQVYVAKGCGYCDELEKFLKMKGIEYSRTDVNEKKLFGLGSERSTYRELPVTKVGNQVIVGYRPGDIVNALGRKGYSVSDDSNRF